MSIRVLLADDREFIRKAVRGLLSEDSGIVVVGEAASFSEALQIAGDLKPQLAIVDLTLANKDHKSRMADSDFRAFGCPVLAISVWNDEDSKALATRRGALILLDKANLSSELIPAIKLHAN